MSTIPSALSFPETSQMAASSSTKLHAAAQQFEALMIGELLKAARPDSDSDTAFGDGEDAGSDSAMDMAQSQFATALAARGGLGLAPMIEKTMSRPLAPNQQASEILGAAGTISPK